MLTYSLSPEDKSCLYEQLYCHIKNDIISGKLSAGEKLPSKRKLAENLHISVITVETAYNQLVAEGYLNAREKRGYFVAHTEDSLPAVNQPLILAEPEHQQYFMDFKTNHIQGEHFPFSLWARLMRQELLEQEKKLLQPQQYNGVTELRQAIAEYLSRARGISVSPAQILVGSGTEYLYNLLIQLLGRDKVYGVENPGYQKIANIYQANDAQYRPIRVDRSGLNLEQLQQSDVDILHISPSHHFPTGIVTPIGRRQELLKWAAEQPGRYIIEDDYDSEFRFSGRPIPTLFSIDENEKVIYINTFSKTIAPSIRISYMIFPPSLMEAYRSKLGFYSCTVPSFEQYTLAAFIQQGAFDRHISRMKKQYRTLRDAVIDAIRQSPLADKSRIYEEDSGLHFLLRLNTEKSDEILAQAALERSIRISCLSDYLYRPDPQYEHMLVINYTGIDVQRLPETLRRLAEIL